MVLDKFHWSSHISFTVAICDREAEWTLEADRPRKWILWVVTSTGYEILNVFIIPLLRCWFWGSGCQALSETVYNRTAQSFLFLMGNRFWGATTALFWVITQRVVVISRHEITTTRCVITQKSQVLSFFAADPEITVLGAFAKFRKATISCVLHVRFSSRPSVRPHGPPLLPMGGFSWNLPFEHFTKICREYSVYIKIWQE